MMGVLKGEIFNHLLIVFPQKQVMSKIKKLDMTEHLIKIWKVFQFVWFHPKIIKQRDSTVTSNLDGDVTMMNAAYSNSKTTVHSEHNVNNNGQSMKMLAADKFRGYLSNGAMLPKNDYQKCPCCMESYMHKPPENTELWARNTETPRKWQEDIVKKYQQHIGAGNQRRNGCTITTPKDCFGNEMTKKFQA